MSGDQLTPASHTPDPARQSADSDEYDYEDSESYNI